MVVSAETVCCILGEADAGVEKAAESPATMAATVTRNATAPRTRAAAVPFVVALRVTPQVWHGRLVTTGYGAIGSWPPLSGRKGGRCPRCVDVHSVDGTCSHLRVGVGGWLALVLGRPAAHTVPKDPKPVTRGTSPGLGGAPS